MRKAGKRERPKKPRGETYFFRLFLAGDEPNSVLARENLDRICNEHLAGRYEIDVLDVMKDAAAAYASHILVTPTLILLKPLPKVTVLGNLGDSRQVLAALRLSGAS